MSNYIEGNKNTVFDHGNFKKEKYELMEETLDDIAANAYGLFDEKAMNYVQETLDEIQNLKEGEDE
jgi:hypothetical protein